MSSIIEKAKEAVGLHKLPTRKLGKNGPHVTGLGFGLMVITIALEAATVTHLPVGP